MFVKVISEGNVNFGGTLPSIPRSGDEFVLVGEPMTVRKVKWTLDLGSGGFSIEVYLAK